MPVGVYTCSDDVVLERWSIRETDTGTRHFVGFNIVNREGRVSTPILTFDPDSRTGTTESGSTYTLVGRAGRDSDGEYVWGHAARAWKVKNWRDVTPELVPDWRMWLPKCKQNDHGDSEGELLSYWDLTAQPAQSNDGFRVDAVRYRASIYTRRYGDKVNTSEPISIINGNGSVVFFRPVPANNKLQFLVAMRALLVERLKRAQLIDEISHMQPCLTVILENSSRVNDEIGEQVARLNLTIHDGSLSGRMVIADHLDLNYGPVSLRRRRGVWDAVLRMLPDWGDVGLISRMDY
ncbi:hypothetical protein B0G81_2177 [Paraburkholderia sp. BL6665CI2N2]|uniref:hypothetical protein n=1 Tax=Paraburkholderia sp. BL6665CI2N2 TaxID=1938806 RepID=UPI0010D2E676|nr:hypothetical protein [Paraburkholderia sp. BL6665CI2N2]TDY21939.1 hypothetical protein B0G81_2177 [Paraburkholderia sp. BL6665CI2N2]